MRTRANVKSHPIHPMFVPFPIAFLSGGLVCDIVARTTGSRTWSQAARWMTCAGMVGATAAAIPGLIDYLYSVPPRSSARRRATWHMLSNIGALATFAAAWFMREPDDSPAGAAPITLETAGAVLMTMGGWMGGTLVHRNFIGPDHRYPESSKYSVESAPAEAGKPITVARAGEMEVDQLRLLRIDGQRIVLGRTREGYCAFQDHCTHRGASLADGVMIDGQVQCLWHGSRFDTRTGAVKCGPAERPLKTYRVEQQGGEIQLWLEEPAPGPAAEPSRFTTQPQAR